MAEDWALWRDSGDFERLLTCWHADGYMVSTWLQANAADFVEASRRGWERGVDVVHLLAGCSVDLAGTRAIAQTRMTIQQRAPLHGTVVDVTCTGRFYDFFECRDDRWAIVHRQPIYERDRIDAVGLQGLPPLDQARLETYPVGYRYLAYLQEAAGLPVALDLPGVRGAAVAALYARGACWLSGESVDPAGAR